MRSSQGFSPQHGGAAKSSLKACYNMRGALLFGAAAAAAALPPNILFLMADQLRFDFVNDPVFGPRFTPNLQRLAADGMRFTKAYTSTPTCTPARSAILTGLSPWRHGMLGYGIVAPQYPRELPRMLAAQGYTTTIIGKNHFILANGTVPSHGYETLSLYDGLGTGLPNGTNGELSEFDTYDAWFQTQLPGDDPLASGGLDWNSWRGATYVYNESLHPTAWTGRLAVNYLQKAVNAQQPWLLKVSFHRPHSPYDPPARWLNATTADQLPPQYTGAAWDARYTGDAGAPSGCGPSDVDAWCGRMPVDDLTLGRRGYTANVRFVDEWIGSILDTLETTGLANNTFVFFVSDHGDAQGDHFLFRKMYPYEISAHVPMLLRWPPSYPARVSRNSSSEAVTELRDILPTFLDIAQAPPEPNGTFDGAPLTCLLQDPTGTGCDWRQVLDLEHDICFNETQHWNALFDGEMKYIFHAFFAAEQLFNVTADPYEMQDVSTVPSYAPVLARMRTAMAQQFEREGRGPTWVKNGVLQRRVRGQLYSPNYPGPQRLVKGATAMR